MAQELVLDARTDSNKNWAWWIYIGHGLSIFFTLGLASFIPLILNYAKRGETEGTFIYSHHGWMIRSFWWYVVWMVIGWVLAATIIGIPLAWVVFIGAWLWKIYRIVRGWIALNNNAPIE